MYFIISARSIQIFACESIIENLNLQEIFIDINLNSKQGKKRLHNNKTNKLLFVLFASSNTVGTFLLLLVLVLFPSFASVSKFHTFILISDSDEAAAAEAHSQQATTGTLSMLSLAWLIFILDTGLTHPYKSGL